MLLHSFLRHFGHPKEVGNEHAPHHNVNATSSACHCVAFVTLQCSLSFTSLLCRIEHNDSRKARLFVYGIYVLLVEEYISARNGDMLPDVHTEEALGMKGQPAGRNLYGAFKTLQLHGRFSRTMIEQALAYSPTSYPEYIQLYLRSLPPAERSMYAADLYNSNFAGIHWDSKLYQNCFEKRGNIGPPIKPAEPLGDNRHEPRQASAIQHALEFHALLNCQYLLDEMPVMYMLHSILNT